jgi:agmatine/peptidylarginine deiminase
MAEFEEMEGIIVRWAYNTQNLLLSQIVDAAQDEGKVWILVRPSTSDSNNIKTYLASRSIPLTNIEFVTVNTNTIWCRDYGPWTVYDTVTDLMGIVDFRYNRPRPQDDVVPEFLKQRWNLPVYQTLQMPDSLVHTGGNFMVDGFGAGFSSKLIQIENSMHTSAHIDSIVLKYCGLQQYVKMDTLLYDEIHHIDMHMKLLDEETILMGQYPPGASDYQRIENTVSYLRTLNDCYGRPYSIIRMPMPSDGACRYPPQSNYLTYTNSLIVNKTVLVPIYGLAGDAAALQMYRDAMPGYRVIGYDCNAIISQLGAIHCITKEIGVREPVHIAHARLWEAADTLHFYRIEAGVKVRSGVDSAFVWWRADTSSPFIRITMTDSSGVFVAHIPQQGVGTHVAYYIDVVSHSQRQITKPLVGAVGAFTFEVVHSTPTAVRSDGQPLEFSLSQNYPNPFNPITHFGFRLLASQAGIADFARLPSSTNQGGQGFVSLKVYDVLGREVASLVNEEKQPGTYMVQFDGSGLASGVYFCRLQAGQFSSVQKMLLMK